LCVPALMGEEINLAVRDFVHENSERYLGWLTEACSFPSLVDEPQGLADMAEWLEDRFAELGATTERLTLEGAPDTILAEIGSGERTLLIYDHYDVQPVDPIELWTSKPFSPEVRGGLFYARGAADNKGDLVARLAGIDAYRQVHGDLPIRLKFVVEGEEETGSDSFPAIVSRYAQKLSADGCIWEGMGVDHADRPMFVFGAKGLAYVELFHRGLAEDQHSFAAAIAPSPVWHLVRALATLRDDEGHVLIDGFYDHVREPTQEQRDMLASYPFDEDAERKRLGIERFLADATGADLQLRHFFQPTCNIAGIHAGFTVPGASKTVLPKEVLAKLDMRLVPDQDPDDIVAKLRKHLDAHGFGDIQVNSLSVNHPAISPPGSLVGRAALAASERVFDKDPAVAPLMAATGPMYPIAHTLGIPTVSPAGVWRPDANIHAPNENVRVDDYLRIIEYSAAWIDSFAKLDA
ncbi:MAG: M20/M25/M40 family metallo-hydrolase, partial [Actinomycetota bacterium]